MPYRTDHKAKTRARIIDSARRLFNRNGFEAVSIDTIMEGAGLTRGGFYHHFANKEELYRAAVLSQQERMPETPDPEAGPDHAEAVRKIAAHIVDAYLSRTHLDDVDTQCPLIALPSDAARAGGPVREAYGMVLSGLIGMFEAAQQGKPEERRDRALAMATLCVGGMVIARTLEDSKLADEVRAAARAAALDTGRLDPADAAEVRA